MVKSGNNTTTGFDLSGTNIFNGSTKASTNSSSVSPTERENCRITMLSGKINMLCIKQSSKDYISGTAKIDITGGTIFALSVKNNSYSNTIGTLELNIGGNASITNNVYMDSGDYTYYNNIMKKATINITGNANIANFLITKNAFTEPAIINIKDSPKAKIDLDNTKDNKLNITGPITSADKSIEVQHVKYSDTDCETVIATADDSSYLKASAFTLQNSKLISSGNNIIGFYVVPELVSAYYGDTLADVKLPDTPNGKWTWNDPTTDVGDLADSYSPHHFDAIFTPSDPDNSNWTDITGWDADTKTIKQKINVTVIKGIPKLSGPKDVTVELGQKLSDVSIPDDAKYGTWTWENPDTTINNLSNFTSDVHFEPNDNRHYDWDKVEQYDFRTEKIIATVNVIVTKRTPDYTIPQNLTATYGKNLSNINLPFNSNGKWAWNTPSTFLGDIGSQTYKATFTPTNKSTYKTVTDIDIPVKVEKATPNVYTSDKSAHFGQTLNDVSLSGQSVNGIWTWDTPDTPVGDVGTHTFSATFTPSDTIHYKTVQRDFNVNVSAKVTFKNYNNSGDKIYYTDELIKKPTDPTMFGYTFGGWYKEAYDENEWNFDTDKVTQDTTLYPKWIVNTYSIKYYINNDAYNNTPDEYTFAEGVDYLPVPSYTGYTFLGWFSSSDCTGNNVTSIGTNEAGDKTLYGKKTANTYNVTLTPGDGTSCDVLTSYTYSIGAKLPIPTKTGYEFKGWYKNNDFQGTPITEITKTDTDNKYFIAKWQINNYTITFNSQNGSAVAPKTADYDKKISEPTNPTKTGYTFDGWYKEATCDNEWNFDTDTVTENTEIYAKWTINKFNVTFTDGVEPQKIDYNSTATKPADPTKTGYTFDGWYNGSTEFDFTTPITSNIALASKWTINKYNVTFTDGATAQKIEYNSTATKPADPTKTGYTFDGWYNGSTAFNFNTPITSNITLAANWTINKYDVTFTDGMEPQKIDYNSTATKPADPTKTGYTFDGWYNGSTKFDFNTPITSDIALTSNWTINKYDVTFTDGVATQNIEYNSTATKPADPTKDKYTFGGWYKEATCENKWDFDTDKITGKTTIYAKWTGIKYSLTLKLDNGTLEINPDSYSYNDGYILPTPTKKGYTFDGWYENSDFSGDRIVSVPLTQSGDKTYYAKWTENSGENTTDVDVPKGVEVGSFDDLFSPDKRATENNKGITDADLANNRSVQITVKVAEETKDNAQNAQDIISASKGKKIGTFFDISILKNISKHDVAISSTKLIEIPELITINIPLKNSLQGKESYFIFRYHEGNVDEITASPNAAGENVRLVGNGKTLQLKVKKFSTYAIGYTEKAVANDDNNTNTETPANSTISNLPVKTDDKTNTTNNNKSSNPKTGNNIPISLMILSGLSIAGYVFTKKKNK